MSKVTVSTGGLSRSRCRATEGAADESQKPRDKDSPTALTTGLSLDGVVRTGLEVLRTGGFWTQGLISRNMGNVWVHR